MLVRLFCTLRIPFVKTQQPHTQCQPSMGLIAITVVSFLRTNLLAVQLDSRLFGGE